MPSDEELIRLSDQFLTQIKPAIEEGPDKDLIRFSDQLLTQIGPYEPGLTGAQQEEQEIYNRQQALLRGARGTLEASPIPGLRALVEEVGSDIVGLGARAIGKGEYADKTKRWADAIEQAASERDEKSFLPKIISRGARGAGRSLGTAVPAGVVGGPYAAIAAASAMETNRAWTDGKDAGKSGRDLAEYAIVQGVIEGAPEAVLQKLGLGGMENIFGKKVVAAGVKAGFKRLGINYGQELIGEIPIEMSHNIAAAFYGVDPEAATFDSQVQTVADTIVQTWFAVGFSGAPGVARSWEEGRVQKIVEEMDTYVKEGKIPSRNKWNKDWEMNSEIGKPRSQRKAFTEELSQQVEATPEGAGITGPLGAPVTPVEAEGVLGPEEAPEAVAAAQQPPAGGLGGQVAAEQAADAQIVEQPPQEGEVSPEVAVDADTVALNNAAEEEIRQVVGLDAVPKEKLEPARALLADVIATDAKEEAITVARRVIKKPRSVTRREHVAMVVKVRDLLGEQEVAWDLQAKASEAGDEGKFSEAVAKEEEISSQLDELVTASQYSGTEISGMFSIRQMRLSRDPSDYASVLRRVQAAIGPKGIASSKQKEEINKLTKENAELTKENSRLIKEEQKERDKQEVADAQEVLNANKPKKGASKEYGRRIREKAETDIAEIKDQIRALGYRVNDITGVSAEGAWLIGRLGVAYIKKGTGTLVEVAERIQADMPDARLSFIDVMKALNARNPKVLAKGRSEQEKKVAKFKAMARIEVQLDSLSRGIDPGITQRAPVDEDIKELQKKLKEARKKYFYVEVSQAKLENAIGKLDQLQDQLKSGQKKIKQDRTAIPPELANINEQIRGVLSEISVKEELDRTTRQIEEGIILGPVQKVKKQVSPEMERNQIRLKANKRAIRALIRNAAPLTKWEKATIVPNEARTLMATGELSYTFRQNIVNIGAHPIRTLGLGKKVKRIGKALRGETITTPEEAFFPSLKAAFSQDSADTINRNLENSPNGPVYETSGLAIMDNESPDDRLRSDVFRGRYTERVPVLGSIIRASARHGVAFSNMARTVNMDHFIHMYPNATRAELRAWANWQNTASGLGSLWKLARAAKELGLGFFSPRFSVSRVQTPFKVLQYWNLPRVRNEIAKDMAKFTSAGLSVLYMASLIIPGSVEWWDVDDPDWGKIRIGNTRWDIFGGYLQPVRLVARILLGATARIGITEEKEPVDWVDLFTRFATFKVGPAISIPRELLSGETAVGEKATIAGTVARHSIMMFLQDTYDAVKDGGPLMGGSVFLGTGWGFGAQTYKDSRVMAYRKIRKFQDRDEYDLANKYRRMWNATREEGEKLITKVDPKKSRK